MLLQISRIIKYKEHGKFTIGTFTIKLASLKIGCVLNDMLVLLIFKSYTLQIYTFGGKLFLVLNIEFAKD